MAAMMNSKVTVSRSYCPTAARTPLPSSLRPVQLSARQCFVSNRSWRAPSSGTRNNKCLVSAAAAAGAKFVAPAIKGSTTGEVFLAGSGALSARIAQELLQVGFKITAGVSDLEEAEGLLDFAKRFEIIRKPEISNISLSEVDFADEESIAAGIPKRGGRVVVALGDTIGRQRVDAKVALRILEAAKAVNAAQFVLVSPSGGSGGGGFLGGLFGGVAMNASRVEQEVVNSGISCVVLRVGKTEGVDELLGSESAVVVGAQQSLPPQAVITKGQVAQVVAQVLRQAQEDVAVEAWADRNAEPSDVAALVAEVLPKAVIEDAGGAADEEPEEAADEDENEDAPPIKLPFRLGGQGTQRVKAPAAAVPSRPPAQGTARIKAAVQEEAQKETRRVGGLFGRAKQAVEEAAEEAQPQKKAAPFANFLGGGTQKVAAKAEAAAQRAEAAAGKQAKQVAAAVSRGGKRAAAAAETPAKQAKGLFGKAAAPIEEEKESDSNPFARLLGGGKKAAKQAEEAASKVPAKPQRGTAKVASRAKAAAAKAASSEKAAPQKKGGFLQSLGRIPSTKKTERAESELHSNFS